MLFLYSFLDTILCYAVDSPTTTVLCYDLLILLFIKAVLEFVLYYILYSRESRREGMATQQQLVIEYCTRWGNESLDKYEEIKKKFSEELPNIPVIGNPTPPRGGAFEVTLGDNLIYSKFATDNLPETSDIIDLVKGYIPSSIPTTKEPQTSSWWCTII